MAPHIYNKQKGIVVSRVSLALEKVSAANISSPLLISPKTVETLVYEYQQGSTQADEESASSSSSTSSEESLRRVSKSEEEQDESNIIRGKKRKNRSAASTESSQNETKENADSSSHSSSSSSESLIGSSEETVDPQPNLNEAPIIEFLPNNIFSLQQPDNLQILKKIEGVAKEIGKLLNDPNEIPNNNVLSRFSLLTRLVMSASTEQLSKVTEKLYQPEGKNIAQNYETNQRSETW